MSTGRHRRPPATAQASRRKRIPLMRTRPRRAGSAHIKSNRVRLTICDLSQDPSLGNPDGIAFTPTIVRRSPGPRTFILGHITSPELLLELLADCQES